MPTKIIVAIAAMLACGSAAVSPALAARGGGFHSGGGIGRSGPSHVGLSQPGMGRFGNGYGMAAGRLPHRPMHSGGIVGIYGTGPYSPGCGPYYFSPYPCY
jgi:hypothetical protein